MSIPSEGGLFRKILRVLGYNTRPMMIGVRVPLPVLLTPGKTFLCHRNDSASQFDIRIEIRHPVFGTTFTQAGIFREGAT